MASISGWAQEMESTDSVVSHCQARQSIKGLKAFFEAGYLWGLGDDGYMETDMGRFPVEVYSPSKFSASASVGCQFNNYVFAGLGAAANVYRSRKTTYLTVPVFAEVRINFLKAHRFTPFADARLGYGIGDMHGVYCGYQLGVRYALPHKRAIYLACDCDFQINYNLNVLNADEVNCNLGLKLGFEL